MPKKRVFFSFDYDNDVFRVQQVRNMGVVEGNRIVTPNEWEEVKRHNDQTIRGWIDKNMAGTQCVIVLIGQQTSKSKWVEYEIMRARQANKPMLGIYIHNLKDPATGTSLKGSQPFGIITNNGEECYDPIIDPDTQSSYNDIKNKIESWTK